MQLLRGRTAIATRLAVSPDSRYVAVTGESVTHLWDLHESVPKAVTIRRSGPDSLEFLSGNRLSMCHNHGWELYDPSTRGSLSLDGSLPTPWRLGSETSAWRVGAVPGGDCTLETDYGADLSLWRVGVEDGEPTRDRVWLQPHTDVVSVLFTPDTSRFVAYRTVKHVATDTWSVYRTADGVPLADLEPRGRSRFARMHFAPDGATLWGADGPAIYSWDALAGGAATLRFANPTGRHILATARHPSGDILAAVTGDQSVHFFDPVRGELLKTYEWPVREIELVAFTPDGTRCVVAGRRGKVLLFDVE